MAGPVSHNSEQISKPKVLIFIALRRQREMDNWQAALGTELGYIQPEECQRLLASN
jgi:hypothetical protein